MPTTTQVHPSDRLHADQADHRLDVQRDVELDVDEAWLLETLRGTPFFGAAWSYCQSASPEAGMDVLAVLYDAMNEAVDDEVTRRMADPATPFKTR